LPKGRKQEFKMKSRFSQFIEVNLLLVIFTALFVQGVVAEVDWYPIGMWIFAIFGLSLLGWERGYLEGPCWLGLEPLLILWLALITISSLASPHRWAALPALERSVIAVIFFYLIGWHFREKGQEKILLYCLIIFPTIFSMAAIGSYLLNSPLFFPFPGNKNFVSGPLISPNNFAGLLNLSVFLGFGMIMGMKRQKQKAPGEDIARRAMWSFPVLVLVVALGLTLSRGGWLTFYVGGLGMLLWLAIRSEDKKLRTYALAILAITILGTFLTIFLDEIPVMREALSLKKYLFATPNELSMDTRSRVWHSSRMMVNDRPWLGFGPGSYWIEFPSHRDPVVMAGTRHSYNDLLELAAESGLVAVAVWLALLAVSIFIFRSRYKREMNFFEQRVSIGIIFGFLAFFAHEMIDFHFQIPGIVYYFLALAAFLLRERGQGKKTRLPRPLGTLAVFAILPLALVIGGIQWASAIQNRRGMVAFYAQEWLEASEYFKSSLRFREGRPEPHHYLAKSYLHLMEGRNTEIQNKLLLQAEKEALRAVAIEQKFPYYWSLPGRISELIERAGGKPLKSPLYYFHQAVFLDPQNPLFLELLSKYLVKSGKQEEAKSIIAKFADLYPSSAVPIIQLWLGNNYRPDDLFKVLEKDYNGLVAFAEAVRAEPNYSEYALAAAEKAFELKPGSAGSLYSQVLIANKQCDRARGFMAKPGFEEAARLAYADCLAGANRLTEAEEQYLILLKAHPDLPQYHLALANVLLRENEPARAKEEFLEIVSKNATNPAEINAAGYLALARISEKEKQIDQAIKYYRLYLEQKPEDQRVVEHIRELEEKGQVEFVHSPWDFNKPSP